MTSVGRVTLFESTNTLAKRWCLDAEGKPQKTSAAQMTRGTYSAREFDDVTSLAVLLEGITTQQALSGSLAHDGSVSGSICTKAATVPGAMTRSKQNFGLQPVPGCLLIDHDAATEEGGMTRDELWQVLVAAMPALGSAGVLWRPSGSSHVCHGEKDLTGLRGQHCFVLLADATDGPRVTKALASRLWLQGLGRVEVSKAGSLLVRCPVDTAPSGAARLIFSGAECVSPLEQRRGPCVVLSDGGFLDTRALVPDLSAEEQGLFEALIEQAKAAAMPQALQRRAEHRGETVVKRLPALMRQGVSAAEAESRIGAAVDAAYSGTLLGDHMLTLVNEDGKHDEVSVATVLSDRDRYHERDCLDPLNPEHRGGSADARLYLLGTSPILYSLDDGGQVFRLRAAQQRLAVAKGNRGELVNQLAAAVADDPRVFGTEAGPVLIERGKRQVLTVDRLMNMVGSAFVLVSKGAKGDIPCDMPRDTAVLVLAALNT